MLNQEELLDYIRQAKKGDEKAKEIIFTSNTPLIKSIIKRFKNKGVEYDDLYQIASIGFIKAINNFDESFNVKFSTYAVPMIIGEIKRYIRDNGAIKVARNLKILANKNKKYINEFQTKNNNPPKVEDLAKVFSVTEEEIVIAMDSTKMPLSIYDKFDDEEEGLELIDKITLDDTEDKIVDRLHVKNIICTLSEREQKIIMLRFFRDKTQSEVAKTLGISQVQVSRLENKIIEKIRLNY